jgi:hypothetical protein
VKICVGWTALLFTAWFFLSSFDYNRHYYCYGVVILSAVKCEVTDAKEITEK